MGGKEIRDLGAALLTRWIGCGLIVLLVACEKDADPAPPQQSVEKPTTAEEPISPAPPDFTVGQRATARITVELSQGKRRTSTAVLVYRTSTHAILAGCEDAYSIGKRQSVKSITVEFSGEEPLITRIERSWQNIASELRLILIPATKGIPEPVRIAENEHLKAGDSIRHIAYDKQVEETGTGIPVELSERNNGIHGRISRLQLSGRLENDEDVGGGFYDAESRLIALAVSAGSEGEGATLIPATRIAEMLRGTFGNAQLYSPRASRPTWWDGSEVSLQLKRGDLDPLDNIKKVERLVARAEPSVLERARLGPGRWEAISESDPNISSADRFACQKHGRHAFFVQPVLHYRDYSTSYLPPYRLDLQIDGDVVKYSVSGPGTIPHKDENRAAINFDERQMAAVPPREPRFVRRMKIPPLDLVLANPNDTLTSSSTAPPPELTRVCYTHSAIEQVVPAGGGKFLVLALAHSPRLAVFDLANESWVGFADPPSGRFKIAANRKTILLAHLDEKSLIRYDLTDLKAGSDSLGLDDGVEPITIGGGYDAASSAPFLLLTKGPNSTILFSVDPESLKFKRLGDSSYTSSVNASADGLTWTIGSSKPYRIGDSKRFQSFGGTMEGASPGASGAWIFTGREILTASGQRINLIGRKSTSSRDSIRIQPGLDGTCVVELIYPPIGNGYGIPQLILHTGLTGDLLADLGPLPEMFPGRIGPNSPQTRRRNQPRVFVSPHKLAKIVCIPFSNDRITLRSVDIDQVCKTATSPFVLPLSPLPTRALIGELFEADLAVRTNRDALVWSLHKGPEGMTVSAAGKISWEVPPDSDLGWQPISLRSRDADGKEKIAFHEFYIAYP